MQVQAFLLDSCLSSLKKLLNKTSLATFLAYVEVSGCSDSESEPNFHSEGVCPPSINTNPAEIAGYLENIPHHCSDITSPRHSLFIYVSEGQTK